MLKILKIGICGSDIHVYHGKHPFTTYPITQGHEISAQVAALGEGCSKFQVGQLVTVEPQVVCGQFHPCRHGKYNLCESLKVMGFQTTGMASTYFAVDEEKVVALPEGMSDDWGAMIEPTAVAVHAVRRYPEMEGTNVAVIGAGPIGILVAQAAKAVGAARVLITDISGFRVEKAKECGLEFAVNTRTTPFETAVCNTFGPDKADVIFDCAGNNHSIGDAIASARKGSTIILVAVFADMASVNLAVLNDHELDLNTTMMYRHPDYVEAIRLIKEGKIRLQPLIIKIYPFLQFDDAYQYIDTNRETCMKVLIDVQN